MEARTGPTIARGRSKQDYPTPWSFIRACEKKFGYEIMFDLAASLGNAKAADFFTVADDSLKQDWAKLHAGKKRGWLWLNPPFDNITPWAKKCAEESARGAWIMFLTPASVGANWFRDHVHGRSVVHALNGRIQFVGADDPYPKDCILSVFRPLPYASAGFAVWRWQDELMSDPMFS